MTTFDPADFPALFRDKHYNRTTELARTIDAINREELFDEYERLKSHAPSRPDAGKRYFVEHGGTISSSGGGKSSNRAEEHLAIALWNLKADRPHSAGGSFRLLDYQFPLKAKRTDKGIGKVDLIGATDPGRLIVVELKVKPEKKPGSSDARGDTPLRALMEGLRYATIVEANLDVIAQEAKSLFNMELVKGPPIAQVLTPGAWWEGWTGMGGSTRRAAGAWEGEFMRLIQEIEKGIGTTVERMTLGDVAAGRVTYGADGKTPTLSRKPEFRPVQLEARQLAGGVRGGFSRGDGGGEPRARPSAGGVKHESTKTGYAFALLLILASALIAFAG